MLTIEIDDSAAVVHSQLAILSELLKFNIVVAEDFTITDSELLHLLNRHRLRESIKAVDTIFSAFTEHQSPHDLITSFREFRSLLQVALCACNAKHRCKVVRGQNKLVGRIRRLAKRYISFCFHTLLQIQDMQPSC